MPRRYACVLALACLCLAPGRSRASVPLDPTRQPAFVRANPRVLERLDDLMAAARAQSVTPAARPPAASPCTATDVGASVVFTWTASPGATGYHLFRDGLFYQTFGSPSTTSFTEEPGVGPHVYCIVAFNTDGVSEPCCDSGEQTKVPSMVTCNLQTNLNQNIFSWVNAFHGLTYTVLRDGQLLTTTTAFSITDFPTPLGPHEYCVIGNLNGLEPSEPCCRSVINAIPPATPTCTATTDEVNRIVFRWSGVANAERYVVTRDNAGLGTFFPPETTIVDSTFGAHHYCVQAFNTAGNSGACCQTGISKDVEAHTRLSWGSCTPQVPDQGFAGPGVYSLILSVREIPLTNVGHDSEIQIHPTVPDAWRFDDGGCQTGNGLNAQVASQTGCPAMLGANSLKIVNYAIAPDGSATLRLAVVYDDLATDPATRYALWRIDFDHASSIGGHDADDATCDGADQPLYFTSSTLILLSNGHPLPCGPETSDAIVTWNGSPVPARPLTWGRLKGLYR